MGHIFSTLLCTKNIKVFTQEEVNTHNKENDCWIIVNKKVYNVTNFIDKHPAGKQCILKKAGTDCTTDLNFHSNNARSLLLTMCIGNVDF